MAGFHEAKPQDIYQHKDGSLYRVVGVQQSPTVIIEKFTNVLGRPLRDEQLPQEHHAVDCLNAANFKRLGTFSSLSEE